MKTITKTFQIYEFKELDPDAQEKAILDHVSFLSDIGWDGEEWKPSYIDEAIEECEKNKTPWFFSQSIYNHGRYMIALELEDYSFYKDGSRYA